MNQNNPSQSADAATGAFRLDPSRRRFLVAGAIAASSASLDSHADEPAATIDAPLPRKFGLGTVTYNIAKDWDLATLIARCEKLGLQAVELRTTHKHGVELSLTAKERAAVRHRFAQTPVKLFGLGTICEFHSPDPVEVKRNIALATQFVQLAHDVGARGVKVRPNGLAEKRGVTVAATLQQIGHALAECGEAAQRSGVEIWVEVHGTGTSLPPHMRAIMDACGHKDVGVTWNSNPTDIRQGSIANAFELLKPFIRCVHIHDLWDYPYRELFGLLRQVGYDRFTMIEMSGSPDIDRLMQYYRLLWNELSR